MSRKEGHSHTEFCPHGSGDDVEEMIQKAIKLGFTEYCVTEHAPIPATFAAHYAGQETGLTEAAMAENDLPAYLKKLARLKRKYASQLLIKVGFEIDYLPTEVDWTKGFIEEYGPQTDESILSLHFLQGVGDKYWCVDDTTTDFKDGLLNSVEDPQTLYHRYLTTLLAGVQTDWGTPGPKRIGHITLFKKFQDYFGLPNQLNQENQALMGTLLQAVADHHYALDYNAAGLYKPYCNETYPDWQTVQQAQKLGIPLVYGSDAHSIAAVGQGIHEIEAHLN